MQSIRYVLVSESVVKGDEPAHYFSRGQRVQFANMLKEENERLRGLASTRREDELGGRPDAAAADEDEEPGAIRAYG